jgi:predicted nucleic acid-binding protein
MLVVSDTSVLINLAVIGQAGILSRLFQTVVAPEAVRAEFVRLASTELRFRGAQWPDWVEVRRPAGIPAGLLDWPRRLHAGERDAIALALEIHADALLVDEEAARSAARAHGLHVTGIVGIPLQAKASGFGDGRGVACARPYSFAAGGAAATAWWTRLAIAGGRSRARAACWAAGLILRQVFWTMLMNFARG